VHYNLQSSNAGRACKTWKRAPRFREVNSGVNRLGFVLSAFMRG
jgi:hypothetical protein